MGHPGKYMETGPFKLFGKQEIEFILLPTLFRNLLHLISFT